MDTSVNSVAEDPVAEQLNDEIASLQAQSKQLNPSIIHQLISPVSQLKSQRKTQTAAILSSHTSRSILSRLQASNAAPSKSPQTLPSDTDPLLSSLLEQQSYNRENLYRTCASITTFRIQDPDPNAVDGGRVLGVRIDVSSLGKFIRPYYVMLNKPYSGSQLLHIHRHTVPPCIPLSSLAERYLPTPKVEGELVKGKKQDLRRFVRELRREAVGYHNRTTVIKSLRKEFKLDEDPKKGKGKERERVIVDISAADAEAKQVRLEWVDGRIGRCVVGDAGDMKKCVVIGEDGRDREVERRILERNGRMELIGERLREGIY